MLYIDLCEESWRKVKKIERFSLVLALLVGVNEKENKMQSK